MSAPDDDLPQSPWKRFFIGFIAVFLISAGALALYTRASGKEGLAVAVCLGLIAGVLSAFGKKMLRLVVTFFFEISH